MFDFAPDQPPFILIIVMMAAIVLWYANGDRRRGTNSALHVSVKLFWAQPHMNDN